MSEKDKVEMEQDLLEAIKNHLPAQVCGLVKERLEEADRLEEEVSKLSTEAAEYFEELEVLRKLKLDADLLEKYKRELHADQAALKQSRYEWELAKEHYELEKQLEARNLIIQHVKEVNLNLTRNTIVRKSILGTEHIPVDGGDCCGHVQNEPIDRIIKEEVE